MKLSFFLNIILFKCTLTKWDICHYLSRKYHQSNIHRIRPKSALSVKLGNENVTKKIQGISIYPHLRNSIRKFFIKVNPNHKYFIIIMALLDLPPNPPPPPPHTKKIV